MMVNLYAVRDVKSGFLSPLVDEYSERAIRNFAAFFADDDPKSIFVKFPADFSFYQIGRYDTKTGEIEPICPPVHLADGVDFLRKVGD